MSLLLLLVLISICIIGVTIGLFLFFRPTLAIDIQKRFYERINWRIEPIDMQREIRTTRNMGLLLVVVALLALVYGLGIRFSIV